MGQGVYPILKGGLGPVQTVDSLLVLRERKGKRSEGRKEEK
jgi:hypothetical protein